MNLFFKSNRFLFFFSLLCALEAADLLASGEGQMHYLVPRTSKYQLPEKSITTPFTSFVKTDDGFLVLGGADGIMILRGEETYIESMQGPVYVAMTSGNRVYFLADKNAGYLQLQSNSPPQLVSIANQVPSQYNSFFPYNMVSTDSMVYMATSEGLFITAPSHSDFIFLNRKICRMHEVAGNVFLEVDGESVYRMVGFEKQSLENCSAFSGKRIRSFAGLDSLLYVVMDDDEVCSINGNMISREDVFPEILHNIERCYKLSGGVSIYCDKNNMPGIMEGNGRALIEFNQPGVLPVYPLNSVFVDEFGDAWLLYDFGLYKMEYPSVAYGLRIPDELRGTILASSITSEDIYLATSGGLAHISLPGKNQWIYEGYITREPDEYINLIESRHGITVAAGNKTHYELIHSTSRVIDTGNFSAIAILSPSVFFASGQHGLIRYDRLDKGWKKTLVSEIPRLARSMVLYNEYAWIITTSGKLECLNLQNFVISEIEYHNEEAPVDLFIYNDELYVSSLNRLWVLDSKGKTLSEVSDPVKIKAFTKSGAMDISDNKNWYIEYAHEQVGFLNLLEPDNSVSGYYSFPSPGQLQRIVDVHVVGQDVWITGEAGLVRVDLERTFLQKGGRLLIDRAYYLQIPGNLAFPFEENSKLSHLRNRVVFELMNTRYQSDPGSLFRYRLLPLQEDWSDWDTKSIVRFNGLKSRFYSFQAQLKSASGDVSEPVTFGFTIRPPLYGSKIAILLYVLILLAMIFLVYKWRMLGLKRAEVRIQSELREKMDLLISEKDKADRLVADLFPKGTAEELKTSGRAKSEKYELATVLFSDIQGFSHIAEEMNPEILIDELDKFFFHFDSVVDKYDIEKIKTIGDAYMAAGGIPKKNTTNPVEVVLAGLEMQYYMADLKKTKAHIWDLRIGIHTGPVISGVVGHKKLSYDIWGDTVNTASRMESSGEPGRVNISGVTYALVKDYFICEYRGKLPVKYKGNIDMYFVNGLRPELSVDLHGIPNRRFFLKLQMLRLNDLEDYVFNDYMATYPVTLHFHSKALLKRIFDHTELLCRAESVSEEDALVTRTAALLMFTGIMHGPVNFENKSVEFAREILPEFKYNDKQIDLVCNLILATKQPFSPQNKLEEILIDAKMEYLGRSDYSKLVKLLYLENKSSGKETSMKKIVQDQVKLQEEFRYFTIAAERLREVTPDEQIRLLRKLDTI